VPTEDYLDCVTEAWAEKKIKSGKAPKMNVLTKAGFHLLCLADNQLAGNASVVNRLAIKFNDEFVAGSVPDWA
jgi:hypothetical protein